jgi:hypothetical protein
MTGFPYCPRDYRPSSDVSAFVPTVYGFTMAEAQLRERYKRADQDHVFAYFDSLTSEEKAELLKQLEGINVEDLPRLLQAASQESLRTDDEDGSARIEPFSGLVGKSSDEGCSEKARIRGMDAIKRQKIAALVCPLVFFVVSKCLDDMT